MTDLVIDSWAWIEYLDGSALGARVRDAIMDDKRNKCYTHAISVAEIVSKEKRRNKDPETAWRAVTSLSKILHIDESDSKAVGYLHAYMKSKNKNFGLADSFVLHAARKIGGRVLTSDPDFRGVKDAIMLR
ncbi:MAG: PIN domain-containing protein [archaeon]|nr:PIN domain-containing protein [archaeon]